MEVRWIPDGEGVQFNEEEAINKIKSDTEKILEEIDENLATLEEKK